MPQGNHQHQRAALEITLDPTTAIVASSQAFTSGAGNIQNANTSDSNVTGANVYNCYSGPAQNYPSKNQWISFDAMWNANLATLGRGCAVFGVSPENTAAQIQDIYNSIQQVAETSLVDHRFILAIIMQEVHFSPLRQIEAKADDYACCDTVHRMRPRPHNQQRNHEPGDHAVVPGLVFRRKPG
jgi:hypothetical protein